MSANMLDGRALAQELRREATAAIAALTVQLSRAPGLAVVQVGDDPASTRYVRTLGKLCASVGVTFQPELLSATTTQSDLVAAITKLNRQPNIDGVLIQMPLPDHLDATGAILALDHRKDVDGVHPINAGLLAQGQSCMIPNTPAGGMELLRRHKITLRGQRAAVVGRSAIVGRPMAQLLVQADATVTICHSRTSDLAGVLRECDIVCVAAGRPGLITAAMIKPGATVIDFGTNVSADGSLVGDVAFAAVVEVAGAITPVPGGTGPVTNMMLLRNLIAAATAA
ncbi:MAG: bifunctional 5,10-methylenetetrahydrofolate dehydrogenase/5,10-methenyltetrahydrofolate cyclohydrolase [Candidatus Viridilinea halotolerans]|uniref:Bifunctional protein FolD n=1 Tax=Candidatus Viridilinea halotolerans TaxID=2491704 RepID=A0A426UAB9_9CHLR|nr:MAG: bifunctional 5,10-methylenetetrahydrofolate dehydrogenase/5,10-methenyltetrahydrofolate cyclohydrolase [Candidatus Viridilinea halotolerans]